MTTTPMPELPKAHGELMIYDFNAKPQDPVRYRDVYSADQMQAYAIAAIEAATEQGKPQWLPIADAPKDEAILLNSTLEGVFEGHWKSAWYGDKSKCGWIGQNLDEEYGAIVRDVTHWMPLPMPPTGGRV